MKCIVLAAGYATRLYPLTENMPKPLLPVGGITILDRLLMDIDGIPGINEHIIISNHKFIDNFTSWKSTANYRHPITIIDDGSTSNETRLGAVRDIQFAANKLVLDDDALVIAGDNILDFSLSALVSLYNKKGTSCVLTYHEPSLAKRQKGGVLIKDENNLVLIMLEKSPNPPSEWSVPPFYIYTKEALSLIGTAIEAGCGVDAPGSYLSWLCQRLPVHALTMPGKRYDVGDIDGYMTIDKLFTPTIT